MRKAVSICLVALLDQTGSVAVDPDDLLVQSVTSRVRDCASGWISEMP